MPGLQVVRIEPDELVTMAAIAKRSGLSREYIRLLSSNQRGPGGFPAPVTYADHKTRLWHWPDIAHWLTEHEKAKVEVDAHAADLVAAMNAALDLREHARHLHDKHDLALVRSSPRRRHSLPSVKPRDDSALLRAGAPGPPVVRAPRPRRGAGRPAPTHLGGLIFLRGCDPKHTHMTNLAEDCPAA